MCDIGGLGEVEEIGVVAKLELGLALVVCTKQRREKSLIIDTKDSRGTKSAGEETRIGSGTVVFKNNLFCQGLCIGVVVGLRLASYEGVRLVGIDQVGRAVADDTGTAGIDKGLDTSLRSNAKECLCAIDVDLVQDLVGHVELGAGSVDDNAGLDLDE